MAHEMFHQGDLQSGIALAVQQTKIVLCFVRGKLPEAKKVLSWKLIEYFKMNREKARNGKTLSAMCVTDPFCYFMIYTNQ
jgi:hypothetical protein